jgi:sodium transport system permease protein
MRWSIIRLIWFRELRDQLRDRRTIFMIAVLPVLLYPVAGFGLKQLAAGYLKQSHAVGVVGVENLVPWRPAPPPPTVGPVVAWLACTPAPPGGVGLPGPLAAAVALAHRQPRLDYPPLVVKDDGGLAFAGRYTAPGLLGPTLRLREGPPAPPASADRAAFLRAIDRKMLDERKVDLLLVAPPDFQQRLSCGKAVLYLLTREKDDASALVRLRVQTVVARWKRDLKDARLARAGLPPDFDDMVRVEDPRRPANAGGGGVGELFPLVGRVFPFILVLWALAGALYPAVDLCAGEKERGTMETLLISPVSREEIVWGKFLTIWVFSAGTALLNLLSMVLTALPLGKGVGEGAVRPLALLWAVLLLLPLSAFFSAVCLSVGAYARSSKEGQYYLMPLFMLTMPLIFLTLAPGVELNPFYSMVPVTGVALLLQRLTLDPGWGVYFYFIPVLAPMVVYSWLALRWAIEQFQREEVLFREAERLDLGLYLRKLLRDKEALPSGGEAIFCFALVLGLRWLSFGLGQHLPLLVRTGVAQLAFVAAPPLFMAVVLTTRPRLGLALRLPPWWAWPAAPALGACAVPPLALLTLTILRQFPALRALLELNHPLTRELQAIHTGAAEGSAGQYFLVLALLPALCEEVAFRGFILTGLLRGFRPWTAVFLSAFLFSLYQMNVFQFVPYFVLGVVLAVLAWRTGSVLPAMLFHLAYNALVIAPAVLPAQFAGLPEAVWPGALAGRLALALGGAAALLVGLYAVWRAGGRGQSAGDSAAT